jgi:tripartite-type tricarboxylate transporter receptor subunit TctC
MKMQLQAISAAIFAAMLALAAVGAHGAANNAVAAFPEKPMRLLVPFAPGGNTDLLARTVGQKSPSTGACR